MEFAVPSIIAIKPDFRLARKGKSQGFRVAARLDP